MGAVTVWSLSKGGIPESFKYFQINADNRVILHVLQTEPSSVSLHSINDNVVRSGTNGISRGFFSVGTLNEAIFLDGDGSSQLLAGNAKLEGDARAVLQMIVVSGERHKKAKGQR